MPQPISDTDRLIERLIDSEVTDPSELSFVANSLRDSERYDVLDSLSKYLYNNHSDDKDVILLRAWYLINIEADFDTASALLDGAQCNDRPMYAVLRATAVIATQHDADTADSIIEDFCSNNADSCNDMALEAARLFCSTGYTDLAGKWIRRYRGTENSDYLGICAEILVKYEKYEEAAEIYRKILTGSPLSVNAWNGLSDVYIKLKDYDSAIDAAEHALATDTHNRKARNNIDMCLLCLNRIKNKNITHYKNK